MRVQAVLPGVTRTELWEKGEDTDLDALPQDIVMDTGVMVDSALAGLDLGERVTIPALPDIADWYAFKAARAALLPEPVPSPTCGALRHSVAEPTGWQVSASTDEIFSQDHGWNSIKPSHSITSSA